MSRSPHSSLIPASESARLAALISPLRRSLLALGRERDDLPDLPDAQIEIIRLVLADGPQSPAGIAEALGASRSAVSNLLAAMERAGLVSRHPNPHDRRGIEVRATGLARDHFAKFDAATSAVTAAAMASLDNADQAAILNALPALERITEHLTAERGRAQAVRRQNLDGGGCGIGSTARLAAGSPARSTTKAGEASSPEPALNTNEGAA